MRIGWTSNHEVFQEKAVIGITGITQTMPGRGIENLAGRQNGRQRKKQWASANFASATITQKPCRLDPMPSWSAGVDHRRSEHLFRPGARRWLPRPANYRLIAGWRSDPFFFDRDAACSTGEEWIKQP